MIRKLLFASAIMACTCISVAPVSAQLGQGNSSNNLFSQYATGGAGMINAGMYPAPYDSPRLGAQSHYTYQPLMPHEMMYQHQRNYFNYYNSSGFMGSNDSLNKTKVRWQSGVNHMGNLPLASPLGNLNYRIHKRIYCIDGNCGGGGGRVNSGGRVRGRLHGGGLGCSSGNCDVQGSAYESDIYEQPSYSAPAAPACSGGCTAKLTDQTINR
ncbi:MAG: hypothetical protein AB8B55_06480 [Mariniblastus sp.]